MSLQPAEMGPVPEVAARVAGAAFPKDNVYQQMRDVLGVVYNDATFAPLFATRGRPAEAPWRLALVTLLQVARRTWIQQYVVVDDQIRLRGPTDMPPPAAQVESPYEPEARSGAKREMSWIGYRCT